MPASIEQRAREVVDEFSMFDDWMGRYEYLIELGRSLPLIDEEERIDAFKIKGCQSQVWVRPELKDGRLHFRGDSDAIITKGLVALLIRVLSGLPPKEIAEARLDFIDQIGMQEHLSPTRKNGLASMIQQMKRYGAAFAAQAA